MPSHIQKEEVACEHGGTRVTRINISRQKKRFSIGTPMSQFFNIVPGKFESSFRQEIQCSKAFNNLEMSIMSRSYPVFFALCQHNNTQHGTQIGFGASNIDVEDMVGDVDDQSLGEEVESCKHFWTDTETENGRHRVFNFVISTFDIFLLYDKLDYVFKELKCAAKVNLAFRFVLKNTEHGMCRYFYAHENNTIMERAKLVCTQVDMTNPKNRMQKKGSCWYLYPRKSQYEVEILQTYKFNSFCFVTQRCTHRL